MYIYLFILVVFENMLSIFLNKTGISSTAGYYFLFYMYTTNLWRNYKYRFSQG